MEIRLVLVGSKGKGQTLRVNLPAVIGRGREATTQLSHPLISRRHCEVYESDGYAVVRDLGSLNGTFIDEAPITEAVLAPGQTLSLGGVLFCAEYDPGVVPPAAASPAKPARAAPPGKQGGETVPNLPANHGLEYDDFQPVEFEEDELRQ